jgi:hypothetical protein
VLSISCARRGSRTWIERQLEAALGGAARLFAADSEADSAVDMTGD